jgi:ribose/xylose/arabinose/galactoside ABC-type transport system permease subunit
VLAQRTGRALIFIGILLLNFAILRRGLSILDLGNPPPALLVGRAFIVIGYLMSRGGEPLRSGGVGPLTALMVIYDFFAIERPATFMTFSNFQIILVQTAVVATAALGATCVIVSGGIDLSVGSSIALCTVVIAQSLVAGHSPVVAAACGIFACMYTGLVIGALVSGLKFIPSFTLPFFAATFALAIMINQIPIFGDPSGKALLSEMVAFLCGGLIVGLPSSRLKLGLPNVILVLRAAIFLLCATIVVVFRVDRSMLDAALMAVGLLLLGGLSVFALMRVSVQISPFIVTLGLWGALRGFAKWYAQDTNVDPPHAVTGTWLFHLLYALRPDQSWMIFPIGVWIMLALTVAVGLVLRYTRFGRHIFAIGSNELTARLCGVRVERAKVMIYLFATLFTGIAGVLFFSHLGIGDPTSADGLELNVIAAVVIGGASLTGGQGGVAGTLVGAMLMTVVSNGCTRMRMATSIQQIVTGIIIVLAAILDRFRHRRST